MTLHQEKLLAVTQAFEQLREAVDHFNSDVARDAIEKCRSEVWDELKFLRDGEVFQ